MIGRLRHVRAALTSCLLSSLLIAAGGGWFLPVSTMLAHAESYLALEGQLAFEGEGVVVAAKSRHITAETANRIEKIHFVQGQIVKEGDLLVEMYTGWKELELNRAEAALAVARAKLRSANDDLERFEALKSRNVVEIAAYNDAVFNAEIAKADYQIKQIEREMAKALLDAQKLYAPFDGQVSEARYSENANVDVANGSEIATIVQLDPIHVEIPTPYSRWLLRNREGVSESDLYETVQVLLELPDGSAFEHHGKILTSGYETDSENGTYAVLVEFPNPAGTLRPGLKVTARAYQ